MPSIRVKGQAYSHLDDVYGDDEPEIPLSADANPSQQHTPSPLLLAAPRRVPLRKSLPFLRPPSLHNATEQSPASAATNSPSRPRGSTVGSRIHTHCTTTGTAARASQLLSPSSDGSPSVYYSAQPDRSSGKPLPPTPVPMSASPGRPYPHAGEMMTLEGLQTDVRMSSLGEPGRIARSINESMLDDQEDREHHHDDVVDHLDVIDMQIGAFSTLTNAANSIVIPPASWYSRKPAVTLYTLPKRKDAEEAPDQFDDVLDRHVDDVLKRPSKLKRSMMGVGSFLRTPMGIITGIYGFLVVFWGAAIVIFLVKIINFHNANTQGFWVEVSSQVETGLFTLTSIGLIPYRALDTYRIWKIWMYKRKTSRLRKKAGLPQLFDQDDLPDPIYDPNYVHVLTDEEQKDLHRQQRKFQYSQTWYRAHGTETHRAFPINLALLICFLNDGNSIFQIFLCGTMWGLNRFQRPAWTTGVLIPASFLCGIGAAIVIWRGTERTKRVEAVKEKLRAALEGSADKDDQLPQSLSRTSRANLQGSQNLQTVPEHAAVTTHAVHENGTSEKHDTTHHDDLRDSIVDEYMTVPSAKRLNAEKA